MSQPCRGHDGRTTKAETILKNNFEKLFISLVTSTLRVSEIVAEF